MQPWDNRVLKVRLELRMSEREREREYHCAIHGYTRSWHHGKTYHSACEDRMERKESGMHIMMLTRR